MTDDVMALLPERPRVLALGEPTHFEDSLLRVRNDLFRQLVEREGFRVIAIESDCLMGLLVDDYVVHGAGSLDEVMERGFSHEFGTMAGNRELVRWMRAYNENRPLPERVRFAGFDGPLEITGGASPREALTGLHGFLSGRVEAMPCTVAELDRLIGDDGRWPNPDAMMDPSQSVGRTAEAQQLRLLAGDLVALLDSEMPHLIATSTEDEWRKARLYGRTATGLLLYHHWMADSSPARLPRVLGQRALMMAANLMAETERGPVMAFAQNSHLQRAKSSIRLGGPLLHWWSAGSIVAAQLGRGYAFVATALGTIRRRGVETPPINTIEGLLYATAGDRFVVDPRELPAGAEPRVSSWFGYAPLDPAHLPSIDAIVYVKDAD
ncbi:erythromycin esterase family protein [Actinoplanes sp. NPDC000266]